jgi:transcriptional antiterminator RfaH
MEALRQAPQAPCRPVFEPGERIAIKSGPFAGLEGLYQLSEGDARAMVLIELMNQPQKLMFAVEMLRKAA